MLWLYLLYIDKVLQQMRRNYMNHLGCSITEYNPVLRYFRFMFLFLSTHNWPDYV